MTTILGLSAFYHDSAACLVRDGEIVAAAQEERFTRRKHDHRFPHESVAYCLKEAGIGVDDLDCVAFYDKPLVKFERLMETYLAYAPVGFGSYLKGMPTWLKEKLNLQGLIRKEMGYKGKLLFGDHHESHAASAFYPSPFEEAAILTVDGVGEWATASYGVGRGRELEILKQMKFPHSLGLLYSAFTAFTGFKVNSGEYKLMGLAPYGEPKYVDTILKELVDVHEDGSLHLNLRYFIFPHHAARMTGTKFEKLFGPPRKPESPITQREMDLARSIQVVVEDVVLKMARHVQRETGMENLCMAGGVALNCVANGRLLREGPFKRIWIQPAAGDAGGALGVAFAVYHRYFEQERNGHLVKDDSGGEHYWDRMKGTLLGPRFTENEIEAFLTERAIPFEKVERAALPQRVAALIADEKVVGLMQGRMEFGPRALGARSIIGDARSPRMQSVMNLKIKYRESFRPFAPSVLRERVSDYFELEADSPYMLLVANVREEHRVPEPEGAENLHGIEKLKVPRSTIPAVTHVDYSARIQTVRREMNPLYYDIINAFYEQTNCPVIVNTSFNVRGEPIVCTPEDAYRCFMRTEMDYLVLENFILDKRAQGELKETSDWRQEFELD
ncbi:MAG TPA: carbamoyltransferase [Pyrinomonadaceae bacterium]|nr:carbamoyltransferase [Pyrinomonadaceae bacterium]